MLGSTRRRSRSRRAARRRSSTCATRRWSASRHQRCNQPAITGSATQQSVFIAAQLDSLVFVYLREQRGAGAAEGAADGAAGARVCHSIDTCAYRLDAWLEGLVTYQLAMMWNPHQQQDEQQAQQGLYLALRLARRAWPDHKIRRRSSADPDLVKDFGNPDEAARARQHEPGYVRTSLNRRGGRRAAQRLHLECDGRIARRWR